MISWLFSTEYEIMTNLEYISQCYRSYRSSKIDDNISPNDAMFNEWYFSVGESAIDNIALAVLASRLSFVERVLDLPCGHGRVLRHITKFFPEADIYACDLDVDGVGFCEKTFGAIPITSLPRLESVVFPCTFDVIWVGSLFTHMPREAIKRSLLHLSRYLSPCGIIVATIHGRWAEYAHEICRYIGEDRWEKIMEEYRSSGYGYCDYIQEESHAYIERGYGVSILRPHIIVSDVEEMPEVRVLMYRERGWADHQDVIVVGKPPYNEKWPGMQ